ncbi:MAG: glycoside hydrolase family 3 C-terminal domain-containing protein [Ignavibacteriales bacterium]|nr:glycoside hydrolase family 3 C-terminal domain-containing protein [Ignavibacteriales bacterium]
MKIHLSILLLTGFCLSISQIPVYKNPKGKIEDRVNDLLNQMTLEEKLDMLSGTGFASKPNERLGIPELKMTDGPVGVRWKPSVAFPASIMLAATFDTSLAFRYGWALARETKAKDRNTILGPCVNINRVPHGGRNFESYGEDPFLASRVAVAYVKGVQSEGVVATTKHFAVNNQETDRMFVNAKVDKRALYEIYFPAFKAAVREAKTEAIMCAYNKLNGPYCSENEMLLNNVLKDEWKFDGLVMSDWGAVHSVEGVATYGLDLEMPGGDFLTKEKLLPLVNDGKIKIATIDDKIKRMLRVMFRMGYFDRQLDTPAEMMAGKPQTNASEHRAVALDVARAGIVLLKNGKNILPLNPASYKSIAVLGPNAEVLRTGGGGSSMVIPVQSESPLDGIKKSFPSATVSFAVGARLIGDVPPIEPQFFFLPNDTTGKNGILAEYFDNKELKGEPKLRRVDSQINFRWGNEIPAEGIGDDNYSVRWTTKLKPALSGTYELTTASDDGVRLYLDGKLLIDHWNDHAVEARMANGTLEGGKMYDVKMEFYENGGDAIALLGWTKPNENEFAQAIEIAKKSELALIFAGNSHYQESEGFDRQSIDLPDNQIQLINEVSKVNPNTIVVLNAGAQVNLLPWIENVRALVWAFFPGQEGTQALMEVLTGSVNPSGKLPFTLAKRWEEYPAYGNFPGADSSVEYAEGIMVGYRYFDTKKVEPLFPFGFGLSYTTFALSDLKVKSKKNGMYDVTVTMKNTGSIAGSEVIQVYVKDKKPKMVRPEKELKAFAKVMLNPGERKTVTLVLNGSSFEYYDDVQNKWMRSGGGYEILAGTSSRDIKLKKDVK